MKNSNKLFLALALIITAFTSCTKQLDVVPPAPVSNSIAAETIADMTASDNFDWSTTKKTEFTFEGSATEEYSLLLQVMDADQHVIFQKMQKSNETYKTIVRIPADQSTITVIYGAESKRIDASTGTLSVNFN